MTTDPTVKLRFAKDSLVASLFELSRAANQTASSIVDFYNATGSDEEEKIEAFTTLTEALQRLTSSTNSLHGISSELVNPAEDDKEVVLPAPVAAKPAPRKRAERDPYAPKKPLTVFFAYSAFVRQELRDARQRAGLPPLSSTEITQEISKKWKELSDDEKEKWKQAYNVELVHYQSEKQKYLEAKKNGTLTVSEGPITAAIPIPFDIQQEEPFEAASREKRSRDESSSGSSEKKKKKKKKDRKKEKESSRN